MEHWSHRDSDSSANCPEHRPRFIFFYLYLIILPREKCWIMQQTLYNWVPSGGSLIINHQLVISAFRATAEMLMVLNWSKIHRSIGESLKMLIFRWSIALLSLLPSVGYHGHNWSGSLRPPLWPLLREIVHLLEAQPQPRRQTDRDS